MIDKEKVIGGLRQMLVHYNEMLNMEPKSKSKNHVLLYHKAMIEDAIVLLLNHEEPEGFVAKPHYVDQYGKRFICGVECGNCGQEISSTYYYCPYCGLPIKWG